MELSIVKTEGIPEGCIVSIRAGSTRRQSPLPCSTPFKLPVGPWAAGPLKIDILCPLGKSQAGLKLKLKDPMEALNDIVVPIESSDGRLMSINLQVHDCAKPRPQAALAPAGLAVPGASNCSDDGSPARRQRAEVAARSYLDKHKLHEFMHSLFEQLLEERPSDPYAFIAMRFCEAAQSELPEQRADLLASTLYGSFGGWGSPWVEPVREEDPSCWGSRLPLANEEPLPDGSLQLVLRSLTGRLVRPLNAMPDETIGALKIRLAEMQGISSPSAIQILWWGDPCQNDLTLDEHGITSGSSIHFIHRSQELLLAKALTGSSDGSIKVWDLESCDAVTLLDDHSSKSPVLVVEADWQGYQGVSGSFDGSIRLWNTQTGDCCRTMLGHTREVVSLDVFWEKMLLVSGSLDGSARFWDLASGESNAQNGCVVLSHGCAVINASVDWSTMRASTGSSNGVVKQWNLNSGECLRTCDSTVTGEQFTIMILDSPGNMAFGGLEDGRLLLWQTHSSLAVISRTLSGHSRAVRALKANWALARAISGSDDGSLSLWNLETGECQMRFMRAHIGMVFSVYVEWSARRILSGSFDGSLKLWDLDTGQSIVTFPGHPRAIWSIVAS